jgi:glycosyltransferase involved in cell wall biosynthesis
MTEWPKISIITPSYNQGAFIEETIQSVLSQGYPNLEYIVVDGGSTDNTLAVLRAYQDTLTWISEPDQGQTDAINKGLKMASGEVLAYLNSDDLYLPGALHKVGAFFAENAHADWLTGYCRNVDGDGRTIRRFIRGYKNFWLSRHTYSSLLVINYIAQPATFWRRRVTDEIGPLNADLYYTMEYEYWLRIGAQHGLHVIKEDLAAFRLHEGSKSGGPHMSSSMRSWLWPNAMPRVCR